MAFASLDFSLFLILFLVAYWFVFNRNLAAQNVFLLIANYVFFAFWDWRFLSILVGSSIISYVLGVFIDKTANEKRKNFLVFLGILQGLGMLLFFKYYNFFADSLVELCKLFSVQLSVVELNLILPLGISFYTFRAISYLIDVKNELIPPAKNWVDYFVYLSFFPTLSAGPIDRARTFLPQLENKRVYVASEFYNGLRQILWGLFKKIVIADNCALITSHLLDNYEMMPGSSLLIGAFLYTIQVYADFSGYSDMAIGIARLLGFKVTRNFNYPFFATNIAAFWQRWHISLTSWMTDYIYTPLSFIFRTYGKAGVILAIIINFVLVGLWHGANLTFVVFGFVQGCFFIPLVLTGKLSTRKAMPEIKLLPSWNEFRGMVTTFLLVLVANIIFMAHDISQAAGYYKHMFSRSLFSLPVFKNNASVITMVVFCLIMLLVEWVKRDKEHPLYFSPTKSAYTIYGRLAVVFIITWAILLWGTFGNKTFIYTKF